MRPTGSRRKRLGTISSVKRRLFNVLAGVSLVLCVATAAIWIRSYWTENEFGGEYSPKTAWRRGGSVSSDIGSVEAEWWLRQETTSLPAGTSARSGRVRDNERKLQDAWLNSLGGRWFLGFFYADQIQTTMIRDNGSIAPYFQNTYTVLLPYWAMCATF